MAIVVFNESKSVYEVRVLGKLLLAFADKAKADELAAKLNAK